MKADDVLARRPRPTTPVVEAAAGLWVEHVGSEFVGTIEHADRREVELRDDSGLRRVFPLTDRGFRLVETGATVTLVPPSRAPARRAAFTSSGAVAQPAVPARVARADRILVEGIHDAELLEKVWGDELRSCGIVVEPIGGVDNLVEEVRQRRPSPDQRLGVLLDHLVLGSREARIGNEVKGPFVLVAGHEFVDVWQAVRPHVLGLTTWPHIPRGTDWKTGICEALREPDPRVLWRRILGRVNSYADLEPSLVGAVERLLDFLLPADEIA